MMRDLIHIGIGVSLTVLVFSVVSSDVPFAISTAAALVGLLLMRD